MVINDRYKFVYIRVAKTGSTSCIESLPFNSNGWVETRPSINDNWKYDKHHVPLWYYKDNILTPDEYKSYFKFAFVRNPFDRLVSVWKYAMKWSKENGHSHEEFPSFNEWIKTPHQMYKYGDQYTFVKGCNFIGKLENIQCDFNFICDRIGIQRVELPVTNRTEHKHYTKYYNEESISIVKHRYSNDIKHFNYEFGK